MKPNKANREAIPDGLDAEITLRVTRKGNCVYVCDDMGDLEVSRWHTNCREGWAIIDYATSIKVLPGKPKVGDWVEVKLSSSATPQKYCVEYVTQNGDLVLAYIDEFCITRTLLLTPQGCDVKIIKRAGLI